MSKLLPHPDPEVDAFEQALLRSLGQAQRCETGRVSTPADIAARKRGRPVGSRKADPKVQTAIRFDPDVIAALKATGRGWQTRVNEVMREWVKTHAPHDSRAVEYDERRRCRRREGPAGGASLSRPTVWPVATTPQSTMTLPRSQRRSWTGSKNLFANLNPCAVFWILDNIRLSRMIQAMHTVAETEIFSRYAARLWNESEQTNFVQWIAQNPMSGDVIPGSGGCRKVRWSRAGMGRRGGTRVIYFNRDDGQIWLLIVYAKAKFDDLPAGFLQNLKLEVLHGRRNETIH